MFSKPTACETWDDDCPAGFKCIPYSEWAGAAYPEAQGCFPVVEEAAKIGEDCDWLDIKDGGIVTLDSCERGLVCSWRLEGCIPLCQGGAWTCPSLFTCTNWEIEPLCWPICDPLESACEGEERCNILTTAGFQCWQPEEDIPLFGPCAFNLLGCTAGTFCDETKSAAECGDGEGCCNAFCDLDGDTCPGAGQTCAPFFGDDPPWVPEYADLGRCAIP